jgi:hypothetical protein
MPTRACEVVVAEFVSELSGFLCQKYCVSLVGATRKSSFGGFVPKKKAFLRAGGLRFHVVDSNFTGWAAGWRYCRILGSLPC